MTSTRPLQATAALLLSAVLAACSGSGDSKSAGTAAGAVSSPTTSDPAVTAIASAIASAADPASATAVQITIKNYAFGPAALTVSPGQTVTVVNQDSDAHTVTASDGSFDTGAIAPGGTATFTAPQQAGAHPYICSIHPFMHGTLTVG